MCIWKTIICFRAPSQWNPCGGGEYGHDCSDWFPAAAEHGGDSASPCCPRTLEEQDAARVDSGGPLLYGSAGNIAGLLHPDGDQRASRDGNASAGMDGGAWACSGIWLDWQFRA